LSAESQIDPIRLAERCSETMRQTDACARSLEIDIIQSGPGVSVLSMKVKADMLNGYRSCQGGIISALADTAFAHACNSYNRLTVAQSFSIEFIQPAYLDDVLTAQATELSRSKKTGLYDVSVINQDKVLVALFRGKSFEHGRAIFSLNDQDKN